MFDDLYKRIISGLIIFIVAFFAFYMGNLTFFLLLAVVSIVAWYEWTSATETKNHAWIYLGICFVILPIISLGFLYYNDKTLLLLLVLQTIIVDVTAYFAGRAIGGPKLVPSISPGKTVSGFVCSMLCSVILGTLLYKAFAGYSFYYSIRFAFIISILAVLGDLSESAFKRSCNIKDSGKIIPGHGGVLDRLDSFTFIAPLVAILKILQ